MTGYLVKPNFVRTVYVAGGKATTVNQVADFLQELGLKAVKGKRNQTGMMSDWRILADLYNHNLQALSKSDLCLVLLDGSPTDTADVCVEMGLAYASGIPVLGLCASPELRASPMLVGMCRGDDQLAGDTEDLKELVKEHIELVNKSGAFNE